MKVVFAWPPDCFLTVKTLENPGISVPSANKDEKHGCKSTTFKSHGVGLMYDRASKMRMAHHQPQKGTWVFNTKRCLELSFIGSWSSQYVLQSLQREVNHDHESWRIKTSSFSWQTSIGLAALFPITSCLMRSPGDSQGVGSCSWPSFALQVARLPPTWQTWPKSCSS